MRQHFAPTPPKSTCHSLLIKVNCVLFGGNKHLLDETKALTALGEKKEGDGGENPINYGLRTAHKEAFTKRLQSENSQPRNDLS